MVLVETADCQKHVLVAIQFFLFQGRRAPRPRSELLDHKSNPRENATSYTWVTVDGTLPPRWFRHSLDLYTSRIVPFFPNG